jgi:hypothetical protein
MSTSSTSTGGTSGSTGGSVSCVLTLEETAGPYPLFNDIASASTYMRDTHVHFRVYLGNSLEATSQLAFPQDITRAVYSSSLYVARGQNTSVTSLGADNVFADGEQYQLCTMSENATSAGYDAALTIGIAL